MKDNEIIWIQGCCTLSGVADRGKERMRDNEIIWLQGFYPLSGPADRGKTE